MRMPSAELLKRLVRLEQQAWEQTIRSEPKRAVFFSELSPGGEPRLIELWTATQEVTDTEAAELYSLLSEASIVDLRQNPPRERKWLPSELALVIAFHKYARLNPSIKVPSFFDLLKEYLFNTVSRLFQKYGWEAGQPDCSTLRPLREWAPEDRRTMIEMLGQVCTRLDAETSPDDP
jgi:hypothetical protein